MLNHKSILIIGILIIIGAIGFNVFSNQRRQIESLKYQVNSCLDYQMKVERVLYELKEALKKNKDAMISAKIIVFQLEGRTE